MSPENKTTEKRIKEAARKIFQEKGYGLTRNHEIAEEAGINKALLNYYFRSKEQLFNVIVVESIEEMFSFMGKPLNDSETNLSEKIDTVINEYINIIKKYPQMSLFVIDQIETTSGKIFSNTKILPNIIANSIFYKQLEEHMKKKSIPFKPMQIIASSISMTIMPCLLPSTIKYLFEMDDRNFNEFIEERRKLIPIWIKTLIKLDE